MILEGRRACTDCWGELLQHELDWHWDWRRCRHGPPPVLAFPVCRAGAWCQTRGTSRAGSAKRVGPAFRAASSRLLPTGRRPCDAARAFAEAGLRGCRPGYLGGRWAPPTPRRLPPQAPAPRGLPRRWSPWLWWPRCGADAWWRLLQFNHDRLGDQEGAVGGAPLLAGLTPV